MSKNFLIILLCLTVAGLLWGAQGDTPDGATMDNNGSPAKKTTIAGGSPRSSVTRGIYRMPYAVLRSAGRLPGSVWRALVWLPRRASASIAGSLYRMMLAFREYATDALGYLARSEHTDMMRLRRGAPMPAAGSGSKPTRRGLDMLYLLFRLFAYPLKVALKTGYYLMRFTPLAGPIDLYTGMHSGVGLMMRNPLVRKAGNASMEVVDYAIAGVWNFTKSSVLPRLDGFLNNLKDSGTMPESLMAVLVELQTLYHIFKLFGMA